MKICILEEAGDSSDAALTEPDWPTYILPYLEEHECEMHQIHTGSSVAQVIELSRCGFDVFINLCDGSWASGSPGIEVVMALERLGLAFTGAGSAFYDPTREAMKRVCHAYGIPTPAYAFAYTSEDTDRAAEILRFPLIVKPDHGYSSVGVPREARVTSIEALRIQAEQTIDEFGGALIEEFVEGREFTVLVAENPDDPRKPIVYDPVEFRFPEGETFKHYDMKWKDYDGMSCVMCDDPDIASILKEYSGRMFAGLGGSGYARCDLRMNPSGTPQMLEINPNCGVFYAPEDAGSADYVLLNEADGHKGFLSTIISAGLNRQARARPPWIIRAGRNGEYRTEARISIPAGGLIHTNEERSHVLVSRSHQTENFDQRRTDWFERYAWPLSDGVFVTWSDDPADWKPINHSCDPNAWLDGLNVVARREIEAGEEITLDYATFSNEIMPDFLCSCGSEDCRGTIRGTDYLQPFVTRYGDHVSDFVRERRKAARSDRYDGLA